MPCDLPTTSKAAFQAAWPADQLPEWANPIPSLFANSEPGAWYDPSDLSTLFQDSAGTTPVTAVGQPVGLQLDKSGRGNHRFQTDTTKRPALQLNAAGKHVIRYNGTTQFLQTNAINFTGTDKMTVWVGVTKLSDAAIGVIVELSVSSGSNNGSFALFGPQAATTATYNARVRGSLEAFPTVSGAAAPDSSVITVIGDIAGDSSTIRRNGVVAQALSSDLGTGNFGNYPLYFGARAGTSVFFNGDEAQMIIRGAASTAAQIAAAERYVASKTGVTL